MTVGWEKILYENIYYWRKFFQLVGGVFGFLVFGAMRSRHYFIVSALSKDVSLSLSNKCVVVATNKM